MRESFTPEEVNRIENNAYEVGVGIGASQERERIIALLQKETAGYYEQALWADADGLLDAIALIKGENDG